MSTDWSESSGAFYLWEGVAVDAYLTPEACRTKALDCLTRADALDDPQQKAAMVRYAEWWNRLAEYRSRAALDASEREGGPDTAK
jgi:hypothetical protein